LDDAFRGEEEEAEEEEEEEEAADASGAALAIIRVAAPGATATPAGRGARGVVATGPVRAAARNPGRAVVGVQNAMVPTVARGGGR